MSDIDRLPFNARRAFNQLNSASQAVEIMGRFYNPDWICVYDNFIGDLLKDEYAASIANGTGAAVTVSGGNLSLAAGTTDNGYAGFGPGLLWTGDAGVYFETEQQIDVITTVKYEVGLTDATDDAGAVNVKATPSATADDYAVVIVDTDDTDASMDVHSRLDAGTAAENAVGIHTLVAATNFTTIFRSQNDLASVAIGSASGNVAVVNAAPTLQGGDSVTPWVFVQNRSAAAHIALVSYMLAMGPVA